MTFVWFVVWLIANNSGGNEPLVLDPVNAWAATLILAVALDVTAAGRGRPVAEVARRLRRRRQGTAPPVVAARS